MAYKLLDRVFVDCKPVGTGPLEMTNQRAGYQTARAAGAATGDVLRYVVEETGNHWEIGWGTFDEATNTITRNLTQSSTGALLNITEDATVFVSVAAEDIAQLDDIGAYVDSRLATQAEAQAGTDPDALMTPLRVADQTTARLATAAEALAGTSTTKLMSPALVRGLNTFTDFPIASGDTTVSLTGLPPEATAFEVMLRGVSMPANGGLFINFVSTPEQLWNATRTYFTTTNTVSHTALTSQTSFQIDTDTAARTLVGMLQFRRGDASRWYMNGTIHRNSGSAVVLDALITLFGAAPPAAVGLSCSAGVFGAGGVQFRWRA